MVFLPRNYSRTLHFMPPLLRCLYSNVDAGMVPAMFWKKSNCGILQHPSVLHTVCKLMPKLGLQKVADVWWGCQEGGARLRCPDLGLTRP